MKTLVWKQDDLPQSADKSTGGALCIQGTNVPDMEETGHLVRHGSSGLITPAK